MTLDTQILLGAAAIFTLRIIGISISTVRMLILVQGKKLLAALLGFFESLVFAVAIGSVVTQLDNVWNLLAYCGGFAVGTYVGIAIESRFVTNFLTVNVVSVHHGHEIAEAVRAAGFGATESWGQGAEGMVGSVRVVVRRREVQHVVRIITRIDDEAFVTLDETRAMRQGYLRAGRPIR